MVFPRERVQAHGPFRRPEQVRGPFQRGAPVPERPPSSRDGWESERERAPSRPRAQVPSSRDDDAPCVRDKARAP